VRRSPRPGRCVGSCPERFRHRMPLASSDPLRRRRHWIESKNEPNVRFPSVDAPISASDFWWVMNTLSDAAICPASDAAMMCCEPVWEFADRIQITLSVLDRTVESAGSSGPVSPTVVPYPPSIAYTFDNLRPSPPQAAAAGAR
jgi:hypothetical protein